jgi:outer membrane lipoprotein-sorting protein
MNNQPNEQLDLLLDRAIAALLIQQSSDQPPPELVAATTERMRNALSQPDPIAEPNRTRLAERRALMFRIARYSSAVAAAVLIAVFSWLALTGDGSTAFAGMIQNVKKAESVVLTNKQTIGIGRTMDVKMYFQGHKMRMEPPGPIAYVADLQTGSAYELNAAAKTARRIPVDSRGGIGIPNPVEQLQKVKPNDARLLGEETLDRRKVQLYQVDRVDLFDAKGTGEMKIWVDPETSLPVKLVVDNPSVERSKRTTLTFTDIVWNKELDAALFQVPGDFTIKEAADAK